jgi:hypothetical protein
MLLGLLDEGGDALLIAEVSYAVLRFRVDRCLREIGAAPAAYASNISGSMADAIKRVHQVV